MVRALFLLLAFASSKADAEKPTVTVGSKVFTESYVLAEIFSQILEDTGEVKVVRKFGLGGTGIPFDALKKGAADLYPEYSGTISEALLKKPNIRSLKGIRKELEQIGMTISESLGFNNTYALAISGKFASEKGIKSISDLAQSKVPIRAGFSYEFLNRSDGYPGLMLKYGLNLPNVKGLEHSLAYEAIDKSEIDLTDAYSTDAKIKRFNLRVLEDDKKFFPEYFAVILARKDFVDRYPKSWAALKALEGAISEVDIQELNALSEIDKVSFPDIAAQFLNRKGLHNTGNPILTKVWLYTKQHLALVGVSLLASIIVGLPLGIMAARFRKLGQIILMFSSVVQTIPSLALLCFVVPFLGIGTLPALVALFLYGLLPIVISTYTGLTSINKKLIESARALGLSASQRLVLVELPLSSPSIVAGIKTSAIISIGTATLAALIGAGGYGTPIVTGLALNDVNTILMGAIPSALMSLVAYGLFEIVDRLFIPKGLR